MFVNVMSRNVPQVHVLTDVRSMRFTEYSSIVLDPHGRVFMDELSVTLCCEGPVKMQSYI